MKPPKPKLTAEERNLQRTQADELAMQGNELKRRQAIAASGGRRSLLSGAATGTA